MPFIDIHLPPSSKKNEIAGDNVERYYSMHQSISLLHKNTQRLEDRHKEWYLQNTLVTDRLYFCTTTGRETRSAIDAKSVTPDFNIFCTVSVDKTDLIFTGSCFWKIVCPIAMKKIAQLVDITDSSVDAPN